jgi:hypothetical protein
LLSVFHWEHLIRTDNEFFVYGFPSSITIATHELIGYIFAGKNTD